MKDMYYSLDGPLSHEIKVKGSRFIGHAAPVQNGEAALDLVRALSKKYHDATHHCFAYRLGTGDSAVDRYSDAGEPAGTAGRPILEAIQGRHLSDTLVVVIRYFGGTKLGTGGLARAYHKAARETLALARISEKYLTSRFRIQFPYECTGSVMRILSRLEAVINKTEYGSQTGITCEVRLSRGDELVTEIRNATAGKAVTENE